MPNPDFPVSYQPAPAGAWGSMGPWFVLSISGASRRASVQTPAPPPTPCLPLGPLPGCCRWTRNPPPPPRPPCPPAGLSFPQPACTSRLCDVSCNHTLGILRTAGTGSPWQACWHQATGRGAGTQTSWGTEDPAKRLVKLLCLQTLSHSSEFRGSTGCKVF